MQRTGTKGLRLVINHKTNVNVKRDLRDSIKYIVSCLTRLYIIIIIIITIIIIIIIII